MLGICSNCQGPLDDYDDCVNHPDGHESPELTWFDRIIWNRLILEDKG